MTNARSAAAWLPDNCTRLVVVDSLQQIVDASKFPTVVGKFTQQSASFVHHTALTDRDFLIRIASSCEIFVILILTDI